MRPRKIKTVRQLRQIAKDYFAKCDKQTKPYTMSGLAVAMGISRHTLVNYGKDEEFQDEVATFKGIIEAQMEERMLTGSSSAAPSIFSLKNNYGWRDKLEIETTNKINIKTVKELTTDKLIKLLPKSAIRELEDYSSVNIPDKAVNDIHVEV